MYFIKFYEDGKFCTVVGQPEEIKAEAATRLADLCMEINNQGFSVQYLGPLCFTYDRYGTQCVLRMEEAQEWP